MEVSVYLEITKKIVSKNVQNMKPVHIAQVSYFAQVLYFAHFSRLNVFSKGLLAVSMKSMLNIRHVPTRLRFPCSKMREV